MVSLQNLELSYGDHSRIDLSFPSDCLSGHFRLPESIPDVRDAVEQVLNHPLEFPPIHQAIVPGDKITLVLDGNIREIGPILDGLWKQFALRDIDPGDITLLRSPGCPQVDPRKSTREPACRQFQLVVHDPMDEQNASYLATSTSGERIYVSRPLIDADFVVTIGTIRFDDQFGFAGTNSGLYPSMSLQSEIERHIGRGHVELTPYDERPLRAMSDEVGWLLGVQFTVQIIPGSDGGITHILGGCNDAVLRKGREILTEQMRYRHAERPETVVTTVESANGQTSWNDVIEAIDSTRRLVDRDGRIVVLTSAKDAMPDAFQNIVSADFPTDAQQAIWNPKTVDSPMASKLLQAIDWARIYLLSNCKESDIEDLFLIPLSSPTEVQNLLNTVQDFVILENAQYVYASIES